VDKDLSFISIYSDKEIYELADIDTMRKADNSADCCRSVIFVFQMIKNY